MKAIVQDRYGDTDALVLADIEVPTPDPTEILFCSACMLPVSTRGCGTS